MTEYIYLLQVRPKKDNVYKFGHTTRTFGERYSEYKIKNPDIKLVLSCDNSLNCEQDVLNLLKSKFKNRKDHGNEYFLVTLRK